MRTTVEGGTGHCKVHAGSRAKLDVSSSACTSLCTGGSACSMGVGNVGWC